MIDKTFMEADGFDENNLPDVASVISNADENAKRAIVVYLFLAMDKKPDEQTLRLFDEFFAEKDGVAGEYSLGNGYTDFNEDRELIIRLCNAWLDKVDADDRYEMITEAIRMSENISHDVYFGLALKQFKAVCNQAMGTSGTYGFVSIHVAKLIYSLLLFGTREGIYEGNRKKLVRFIVRFTKRDKASLAEMEEIVQKMPVIEKQINEVLKNSATGTYEQIFMQLEPLKNEKKSLEVYLHELFRRDLFEKHDKEEQKEEAQVHEEYTLGERITDGICEGIERVTDFLCSPLEFLTDKITDLSLR
jgi:hypothetical protein